MEEDETTEGVALGDLIPGLEELGGEPDATVLGGPLARHLARRDELTWKTVASMSPKEIALVPSVGPVRTKRIRSNLAALVGADVARRSQSATPQPTDTESRLLRAVEEIAAWAVGNGHEGSVSDALRLSLSSDAVDVPRVELEWLSEIPASAIAPAERVGVYDPVATAESLIGSFDERERATLDRVLDFDGSAPTLQEIGDRFDVTRERIRQVETKVRGRLDQALASPATRSLVASADSLRERLGAAVPSELLVEQFAEFPPDQLDRLILHLAGPYRFDGDWYVLSALGDFAECLRSTFDSVADDGVAPLAAFVDALGELGIRSEFSERAVRSDHRFSVRDDVVLDWSGSMSAKAVMALSLAGHPLSIDDLVAFVQPSSERSMSNQVHADERMVRVGVDRFALAEWGIDEFPGIVPAMVDRLSDGPMGLDQLRDDLVDEYSVSPNSVSMMASMHPGFLLESGTVMLRPADRPYVPSDDIEGTRGCYLVDGVWSWRILVDHDILRGSGRTIPEAFAVHLGAVPLEKGMLESPVGRILLSWRQNPAIGSLRAAARSLEAEEGDWLFVRRIRPSGVDFRLIRSDDVPSDPDGALRALVGAPGSDRDLEQVLSDALGLRGSVNHDLAEERAALVARKEHDLVALLDEADHSTSGESLESDRR